MNITKRQLKKIITEELQIVLNEVYRPEGEGYEGERQRVEDYLTQGATADRLLDPYGVRYSQPLYAGPPPSTVDEQLDEEDAYLAHVLSMIQGELEAEAAGGRLKGTGGLEYPRPSDSWQSDEDARRAPPLGHR
jgi:hypothetical protein